MVKNIYILSLTISSQNIYRIAYCSYLINYPYHKNQNEGSLFLNVTISFVLSFTRALLLLLMYFRRLYNKCITIV